MARKSLAERLNLYRLLIKNSRDPEIAPLLEKMGVDSAYLDRGDKLYEEAIALVEQQKMEYQEQSLAYDKFNMERFEVKNNHDRTVKLVKTLSRHDEDLQNRLNLPNGRSIAIEKWFENAITFYNSVMNEKEFLASIAKHNVTPETLESELSAVRDLKSLRDEAIREKGQAQESTRLRNEKLDELEDYCVELEVFAELALEDKPQLLEKLGILVRS